MKQKIALGTVQFGLDYGISNKKGQVSKTSAKDILTLAKKHNISLLDTAAMYGEGEKVLGNLIDHKLSFDLISKTPSFHGKDKSIISDILTDSLEQSLRKLNVSQLYGLLVHHADDLLSKNATSITDSLKRVKGQGLVKNIGFSCYNIEQIKKITSHFVPDIIQLPCNIFNQEIINHELIKTLKGQGVQIHVRSIFLQGLVFLKEEERNPYFSFANKHINYFHDEIQKKNISPLEASLTYAINHPHIDQVIVGVCHEKQLQEILTISQSLRSDLSFEQFAISDERLTNPSLWKLQS